MGQCVLCGRSGFFLRTSEEGLCAECRPGVLVELQSRLRVINESANLIDGSKNYRTRLSRCDVAIDNCQAIIERYESRGVRALTPPASELIERVRRERAEIMAATAEEIVEDAKRRADAAATTTGKAGAFGKAVEKLGELQKEFGASRAAATAQEYCRQAVDLARVAGLMDEGQKAEFKGNAKRALDRYQEALYAVLHDRTDDREQRELIATLSNKIVQLGGDVPSGMPTVELRLPQTATRPGDAQRLADGPPLSAHETKEVLDEHFRLSEEIKAVYAMRNEDPTALARAVDLCLKQIELAPRAARAWSGTEGPAVSHRGFQQLAIIREKQGDLDAAIQLCQEAQSQGWLDGHGAWSGRIARLEAKKAKAVVAE